jgi:hypothetical protein
VGGVGQLRHRLDAAEHVRLLGDQAGTVVLQRLGGGVHWRQAARPVSHVGAHLDDLDSRPGAVGGKDAAHLWVHRR